MIFIGDWIDATDETLCIHFEDAVENHRKWSSLNTEDQQKWTVIVKVLCKELCGDSEGGLQHCLQKFCTESSSEEE